MRIESPLAQINHFEAARYFLMRLKASSISPLMHTSKLSTAEVPTNGKIASTYAGECHNRFCFLLLLRARGANQREDCVDVHRQVQ